MLDEEIIRDFGARVRAARLRLGLTQEELGKKIGADKSRISDYENGRRKCSLLTVYQLGKALDVSFDYLIEGKDLHSTERVFSENREESLSAVIEAIGCGITRWGLICVHDDEFGDYSVLHAVGSVDEEFGATIKRFEMLNIAGEGSIESMDPEIIRDISKDCAKSLLEKGTFQELFKND